MAGLAALIFSYFPTLTAEQVRYCIEKGAQNPGKEVTKPGGEGQGNFADFSKTGGIINAYESVKIAATLKGERVPDNVPVPKPQPKPKVKNTRKG